MADDIRLISLIHGRFQKFWLFTTVYSCGLRRPIASKISLLRHSLSFGFLLNLFFRSSFISFLILIFSVYLICFSLNSFLYHPLQVLEPSNSLDFNCSYYICFIILFIQLLVSSLHLQISYFLPSNIFLIVFSPIPSAYFALLFFHVHTSC